MSPPVARPFPWGSLDATSRAEVMTLRAVRAWSSPRVRVGDVAPTVASLLGARVEVSVRRAGPLGTRPLFDGGFAVVLAASGDKRLDRSIVVEAEATLVTAMIAHAVRRPLGAIRDASRAPTAGIAGAFAAIVSATARRAHGQVPMRVIAAGPSAAVVRDIARAVPDLVAVEFVVLLDDDAHVARVLLPRSEALLAQGCPWDGAVLAALGETPIEIPVVAVASLATTTEVALLSAGDAWLPGSWPLRRGVAGRWTGPVLLGAVSVDFGIGADLGDNGQLVLRGDVTHLGWAPTVTGAIMAEAQRDALIEAVGEVPLVVRVEIGTAQLRAREWANLAKGDVIALGRRIADSVVLRVGDVAVARGELVDLEGEVAVRIVERLDGKEART